MATGRTQQQLINFHSSGTTDIDLQYLNFGEIAVRHAPQMPQLIIKTGENTKAIFVDSGSVYSMINSMMDQSVQDLDALKTAVSGVSGSVVTLSGGVETFKTTVNGQIESLQDDVDNLESGLIELSGYVENNCATTGALETEKGRISANEQNISNLSGAVTSITANYATTAYVNTTSANTLDSAKQYTNQVSGATLTEVARVYATSAALETAKGRISTNEQNISNLSGAVESMETDLTEYIDEKISVVYKFRGTKNTYEQLPTTGNENGDVWNVISGHGTTPPGTNYAWNASGGTSGEWDALGGSIDLSGYATTGALETEKGRISANEQNISNISGAVTSITANYATTAYVNTTSANTLNSAKQYTNEVSGAVLTEVASVYATSAALETAKGRISTNEQNISNLSGQVVTIKPIAESALQGYKLTGTGASTVSGNKTQQMGVVANYTAGGNATLDLSGIIIDCGTW